MPLALSGFPLLSMTSNDLRLNPNVQALRERAEVILFLRTQMARFGIRVEDLQAAGCFLASREPLAVARSTA
ncbi:hypothetical protein [Cupriavidus sp. 8B]